MSAVVVDGMRFGLVERVSPPRTDMMRRPPQLDAVIEAAERILRLLRECGFDDCVAAIVEDVKRVVVPALHCCLTGDFTLGERCR
jgi:hypothetical protein